MFHLFVFYVKGSIRVSLRVVPESKRGSCQALTENFVVRLVGCYRVVRGEVYGSRGSM